METGHSSTEQLTFFITGASSGIGKDASLYLASQGYRVFAGVRSLKARDELLSSRKSPADSLIPVLIDVTSDESVAECFSKLQTDYQVSHLNGLVNNAGIAVAGPLEAVTPQDFRQQFEVNVIGLHAVTFNAIALLRKAKGRVVNISSVSGLISAPLLGPYCSSKFAVEAYSDCLRRELNHQGMHVSIIEPGPIRTPIWEKSKTSSEQTLKQLSVEQTRIYGSWIQRLQDIAKDARTSAPTAEVVTKAIAHALTSQRPRLRYPIGKTGYLTAALAALTPHFVLGQLVVRQLKF